ncbi:MAG: 6-bladed beta-propeller [Gemmatimonadota bacterium]|nr:MAG: 6-bladed beta-propeller [Gemmatimonadota bacterium]
MRDTGTWVSERDTIADTIVVRTLSGSVWGTKAKLEEVLSIGVVHGPEEFEFGEIAGVAVDGTGGVYVFDRSVPALRYYDSSGRYVRTLGRTGSGPGEYQKAFALAVREDGLVVLHDPDNQRLNVYEPDGRAWSHWHVPSNLRAPSSLHVGPDDHVYLEIFTDWVRPRGAVPRTGLLHLDAQGNVIDTIKVPRMERESAVRYPPHRKLWAWSRGGLMVVGVNDLYSLDVHEAGQTVVRIEKEFQPIPYEKRPRQDPLPEFMPPYSQLHVGDRGRIWIAAAMSLDMFNELQAAIFDVFEPNGAYLGQVHIPKGASPRVFRGDTVWATKRGEYGEPYIAVYRVVAGTKAVR